MNMTASEATEFDNCAAGFITGKEINKLRYDPAEIGKAAHEYAEIMLKGKLELGDVDTLNKRRQSFEMNSLFYDVYFAREVMKYVDYCVELVSQAKVVDENPVIVVEEFLDMGSWSPGQTSKVDFAVIASGTLAIVDMKTGAFSESAENNNQLLFYALAMMKKFYTGYNVNKVQLTIVNTKSGNTISATTLTSDELLQRGYRMRERKESLDLRTDYTDDHCRKCRLGSACRHHYIYMTEKMKYMMNNDAFIDFETEASEILKTLKQLETYARDMKEAIRREAIIRGIKIEGYKLTRGQTTMSCSDDAALVQLLIEKYPERVTKLLRPRTYFQYDNMQDIDDVLKTIKESGIAKIKENKSKLVRESMDSVAISHKEAILDAD